MILQNELNIAVLIYGRLKKANDSFSHIKNSLKKYNNIDFFLSTDNSNSTEIEQFIKKYNPKVFDNTPKNIDYISNKLVGYKKKHDNVIIDKMLKHFLNKLTVFNIFENYYLIGYDKTNESYNHKPFNSQYHVTNNVEEFLTKNNVTI